MRRKSHFHWHAVAGNNPWFYFVHGKKFNRIQIVYFFFKQGIKFSVFFIIYCVALLYNFLTFKIQLQIFFVTLNLVFFGIYLFQVKFWRFTNTENTEAVKTRWQWLNTSTDKPNGTDIDWYWRCFVWFSIVHWKRVFECTLAHTILFFTYLVKNSVDRLSVIFKLAVKWYLTPDCVP